jgi:hypothetical protein
MRRPAPRLFVAVAAVLFAGCGGAPSSTPSSDLSVPTDATTVIETPSTAAAPASRFAADAGELTAGLRAFDSTLAATSTASEFPNQAPNLRRANEAFRAALERMNDYHLTDSALDTRRRDVVDKAGKVEATMARLVTAAPKADSADIQAGLAAFRDARTAFLAGATPGG